jgi:hypothetical protein
MFMSYIVYSGLRDLLDAIQPDLEARGYKFVMAETPEADAAIAESGGEYVVIDYNGGDFATVSEVPHLGPKMITVPSNANGAIPGYLASELIRSYIEAESAVYVEELERRAAECRDSGATE